MRHYIGNTQIEKQDTITI